MWRRLSSPCFNAVTRVVTLFFGPRRRLELSTRGLGCSLSSSSWTVPVGCGLLSRTTKNEIYTRGGTLLSTQYNHYAAGSAKPSGPPIATLHNGHNIRLLGEWLWYFRRHSEQKSCPFSQPSGSTMVSDKQMGQPYALALGAPSSCSSCAATSATNSLR